MGRTAFLLGAGFIGCVLIIITGLGFDSLTSCRMLHPARTVFIEKGMGTWAIARLLETQGVLINRWVFMAAQQFWGHSLKTGEYLFQGPLSVQDVLTTLTRGEGVQHYVTIPEGLTTQEIVARLKNEPLLKEREEALGAVPLLEGSLLPETYAYKWGDTLSGLLQRMGQAQRKFLERFKDYPLPSPLLTQQDLLILASIVEKEAALPQERSHVAGVFLNRLRLGMPLQADPTVLYGLGVSTREPTLKELKKDTPYNTYLHKGLPPTPICNPGKEAIKAVLLPLPTQDLYFVANGKGGHIFSKSLRDHQRSHVNWRHLRHKRQLSSKGEKGGHEKGKSD